VFLDFYVAALGHFGFTTPSMQLIHRAGLATLAIKHFSIHSFILFGKQTHTKKFTKIKRIR